MHSYICTTCGQAYAPAEAPPDACPICRDERQYINPQGQAWTTLEDLQKTHRSDIRAQEPGLFGIGATPSIAIGQRALFIAQPGGGVLWDCTPLLTDEAIAQIGVLGGLRAIAISHPHYYASMVDWSRAFGGVPIYIHADDAAHITRPDPAIVLWQGETGRHQGAMEAQAMYLMGVQPEWNSRGVPDRLKLGGRLEQEAGLQVTRICGLLRYLSVRLGRTVHVQATPVRRR